jgi:hypothetical protein
MDEHDIHPDVHIPGCSHVEKLCSDTDSRCCVPVLIAKIKSFNLLEQVRIPDAQFLSSN